MQTISVLVCIVVHLTAKLYDMSMQETVLDFAPDHASSWNQFVDIVSGSWAGWRFLVWAVPVCGRREECLCSTGAFILSPHCCASHSARAILCSLQVRFNLMTSDWVSLTLLLMLLRCSCCCAAHATGWACCCPCSGLIALSMSGVADQRLR